MLNYRVYIFNLIPQLVMVDGCKMNGERVPSIVQDPSLQSINELLDESTLMGQFSTDRDTRSRNRSDHVTFQHREDIISTQPVSNRPKSQRSDHAELNEELLERLDHLEQKLQSIPKPETPKPLQEVDDRFAKMEDKIGMIVDAMAKATSEPKQVEPEPESVSLKTIESQMKELIQLTINKENQPIIIKKTKDPVEKLEQQRNAFKELGKQLFGTLSPSSSDEVINIPKKSPGRSVIYIQENQAPEKENIPPIPYLLLIRQKKPIKVTSRIVKREPEKNSTTKLIAAFEAEERRMKDNELRYAEKIKALTMDLQAEKQKTVENKHILQELQEYKLKYETIVPEHERLKCHFEQIYKEHQELVTANQNFKAQEPVLKNSVAELENETKGLQQKLDSVLTESSKLKEELSKAKMELQKMNTDLEQTSAVMGLKLLQTKEHSKLKLLELKKENEILKETVDRLKQESQSAREKLSKKEEYYERKLNEDAVSHKEEVEEAVSKAHSLLDFQYKSQLQSVQDSLKQSHQAYQVLEQEFLKGINTERTRKKELESMLKESKTKERGLKELVSKLGEKEKEHTKTIGELVSVVKNLKTQNGRIQQDGSSAFRQVQERLKQTEERLGVSETKRRDLEAKMDYARSIRPKLEQLEVDYRSLYLQHQTLTEQNVKLKQMNKGLEKESKDLQARLESTVSQTENGKRELVDALKIKDSMLEDQNQTIRALKSNLENKIREFQKCKEELEMIEEKHDHQLLEMKKEIDILDADEQHYRSLAKDYKHERDQERAKAETLNQKLLERNQTIEKIEKEVERVKIFFESRQNELIEGHKRDLEKLESKYQNDQQNVLFCMTEKEALLQRLKESQKLLQRNEKQREHLEKELRFVLGELEKEKMKSSQKLSQLKRLLTE